MSFARELRRELAGVLPDRPCCRRAELRAMVLMQGEFSEDGRVCIQTRQAAVARKTVRLLRSEAAAVEVRHLGRRRCLVCGRWQNFAGLRDRRAPSADCCRGAWLRGAFLCRGSMADPVRGHHLEFSLETDADAADLRRVLQAAGLRAGQVERRGRALVYLKDADEIGELLGMMGGHAALLLLESRRVAKDVRSSVNRLVNCDTANVAKTVNASLRQIAAIRRLSMKIGLDGLPPALAVVARARLDHPYASLEELGARLSPPLSKSGVQYRMERLLRMAEGESSGEKNTVTDR